MALKEYGVLKGSVVDRRLASGSNPHYQLHIVDHTTDYRIAVNVQSQDKSQVQYVVAPHFRHPILDGLQELPLGFRRVAAGPNGLALDFIRANLVDKSSFVPLPLSAPGPDNDLNEKLDHYVQRAMGDESAVLYAFGERWGPEAQIKDKIFGFLPGNGVHDIHMNQGNDPGHAGDDGVWQDGGLLFQFPQTGEWVAILLKFQSQAWHTDERTGHALAGGDDTVPGTGDTGTGNTGTGDTGTGNTGTGNTGNGGSTTGGGGLPGGNTGTTDLPTTNQPDGIVRIVAALVNSKKSPEVETVTLLNASPATINLQGWSLLDKAESKMALSGELKAGEARTFVVKAPMVLSNKGGLITLLNAQGLKVDGVSYTKTQAGSPGWTIVF
ncbi:MAG TPA: DUF2278 family protein [Polyangiaceae bacterium]|jgi:uncharacterized protein YukJ|nr:DUF2278 family protein [Polyangiaceae bacterium]